MAVIRFTDNLKRHLDCPPQTLSGETVADVFQQLFAQQKRLQGYLVDEQGRLRKHVLVSVDNILIHDRIRLSDPVSEHSEIYVMQALSGG